MSSQKIAAPAPWKSHSSRMRPENVRGLAFDATRIKGAAVSSGFLFPLETAAPFIRVASNASPLTFSGRILEEWLFHGAGAAIFWDDIRALGVQAAAVAAMLAGDR